jgi:ATPase family AAA domain-containing protein 1
LDKLADFCEGYSNSDIKELCRNAVMVPVREAVRNVSKSNAGKLNPESLKVRKVKMNDFMGFIDSLYSISTNLLPISEAVD